MSTIQKTDSKNLGIRRFYWQNLAMNQKPMNRKSNRALPSQAGPDEDDQLAPITAMMSSRLIVLANLLKRGALLRYRRLAGLSSVEFGLVASLGRRPPMSVIRLADAVGMDKGQISRALAELVSRKLVSRAVNPRDNREVLVCLTRTGLVAHDAMVAGALERNQRLLEELGTEEMAVLLRHVDRLTDTAAKMLEAEKDLN
jgi:DNA-binding MarR family transcriptional regulator